MKTREKWSTQRIDHDRRSLMVCADDGATYGMYAPRARRVVACVNACLGLRMSELKRMAKEREKAT